MQHHCLVMSNKYMYVPLHVLYVQYALYHTHREYLLSILLHLTLELMKGEPPHDKDTSLAGSLSAMLLKVHVHCIYMNAGTFGKKI